MFFKIVAKKLFSLHNLMKKLFEMHYFLEKVVCKSQKWSPPDKNNGLPLLLVHSPAFGLIDVLMDLAVNPR